MPDTSNTCSLDSAAQEKRFGEFAELASVALVEAVRTPRGARLLLRHGDSVQASLWRLIEAERRCCSFLEFSVEVTDPGLWVEVSGPPSARPLIDRLFDHELAAGAAVSHPGETKTSKWPALAALGGGLALVVCCVLAPVLIGAAWMLALGPLVEALLIGVAVVLGAMALRRHRANRCC